MSKTNNENIERHLGWEIFLDDFLKENRFKAFEWGVHDCAILAAKGIESIKHIDVLEHFQGSYDSEEAMKAFVASKGGALEALATELLGPPDAPLNARRGDIVLGKFFNPGMQRLLGGDAETFAICVGHKCAAVGDKEMVYRPLSLARMCWHV